MKKEILRFSEAKIQATVTQPQLKLILSVLSQFRAALDTEAPEPLIESVLSHANIHYGFKIDGDYLNNQEKLKLDIELMLDDLIDFYTIEKGKLWQQLQNSVVEFFDKNIDPEIFDIADGEPIKVANYE